MKNDKSQKDCVGYNICVISFVCFSIVVTDVPSYRQTSGESVFECVKKFCPNAIYEPDNGKALKKAMAMTGDEGFLCIAGSLYLAGAMRSMVNNEVGLSI